MNKLYNDTAVQAIANAIRAKNGSSDTYTIAEMSTALNDLSYYAKPTIENVPLATFEADGLPFNSLKVSVEAKQEGSGTPSPENVRPISGWDAANVTRCGKNLATESSGNNKVVGSVRKGYTYTFSIHNTGTIGFNLKKNSNSGYVVVSSGSASSDETISVTFTADDNYNLFVNGYGSSGTTYGDNASNYQLEIGNTPTTYEPYNGTTTTISLPQTVYGGEVDVVNGVLTITHEYIASYNGETLPSTWISSMDVYAEGTTPTTGAEVCYELAEPIIINLTPSLIKSLNGTNNLSVDCGDVIELEYFKEV